MKTGLVLEGGAMRGMYTAGALDVLLENDINFDGIIGTSAGAVFGVNFLSRQDGRVIRYNCRFNGDRNYMGIKPLLKSGDFFNTEYAYYKVPNELDKFDDEAYQKSGSAFLCNGDRCKNGKAGVSAGKKRTSGYGNAPCFCFDAVYIKACNNRRQGVS